MFDLIAYPGFLKLGYEGAPSVSSTLSRRNSPDSGNILGGTLAPHEKRLIFKNFIYTDT